MLRLGQHTAVVGWLGTNNAHPTKAIRLWALLLQHIHPNTGQIMLSHEQIAEEINTPLGYVSKTMSELVKIKVIFTGYQGLKGFQRSDQAVYFMNKHVAEVGSRATEKELKLFPKPNFEPQAIKEAP